MGNKIDIEINLENLAYNVEKLRKIGGSNDSIIPTVKANAYNIGVYDVVKTLINLPIPQKKFFVFALNEGIELRLLFPELEKIYIFNGIFDYDSELFKKYNLTPVINSMEQLKICKKCSIGNVVLQFNTGMNRAGIELREIEEVKKFVDENNIMIDMVMSHFCCADDKNNIINQYQIENFKRVVEHFPDSNIGKSLSASDGIINFDLSGVCNIHRPGLALYGYYDGLKPVYSIYSTIEYDGKNLFLPLGIVNGFTSDYGDGGSYVIVNGNRIGIKSIDYNRVILDSNDKDFVNHRATILGGEISYQLFEKMCKTDIREIVARLISNCDDNIEEYYINVRRKRITFNDYKPKAFFRKNSGKFEEFYSTILEKREVYCDGIAGYGATEYVKKGDKLAVFFGGYLDGIARSISNRGCSVFVEDKMGNLVECPIVGRISMDQTIVKVPNEYYNNIDIGAKVIIFDKNHLAERFLYNNRKTLEELFFYLNKSSRVFDLDDN